MLLGRLVLLRMKPFNELLLNPHVSLFQMDQRKKDGPSPAQNARAFKRMLSQDWEELPWCFETSGKTGVGKSELLGYIASINEMFKRSEGE